MERLWVEPRAVRVENRLAWELGRQVDKLEKELAPLSELLVPQLARELGVTKGSVSSGHSLEMATASPSGQLWEQN